ncbi:hypothetical protein NDI56_11485 [Haloarcula sp. S1CR25-12]|uniref:Uncharacterized protein n=1 Tax=Haloarcula saliterrae TaxID=2950534 RepID=A0ABU2FE77_9EURY|nr:hypothetical protein [Haloarcula sp. S1CR25-12]MDS0260016.1 hypothetical protein [Haloarcula sp. S1CR25-12]
MSVRDIAVYDHLRSTDPDDDAVYRVVGTDTGTVTLLRVSDDDGRRAHTGEVVTRETLDSFEPAENPDGNRSVGTRLRSVADAAYWAFRTSGPLIIAGVLLAVVGTLGNVGLVALPPLAGNGLLFAGFGCIVLAIVLD